MHREIGVKSDKSVSQGGFVALFEHELRRGLQGTGPISLELDSALATSLCRQSLRQSLREIWSPNSARSQHTQSGGLVDELFQG